VQTAQTLTAKFTAAAPAIPGGSTTPASIGTEDRADRHPDVAFGGGGELVVVWESKELSPAGKNLSVRAAVSTDGGKTFAAPVVVGGDDKAMSQRPRLGVDANGSVRAVWYDSRSPTGVGA